jgi:hypothetical protein
MRGKRGSEQPGGPRLLIAMAERALRKNRLLDADDQLIEWKQGNLKRWCIAGLDQPIPPVLPKLDIPRLRGLSGCCYSSRRLFIGSRGRVIADLACVWRADTDGKMLRMVFSSQQLNVVRWQSDENEDAAALASFAERIKAQRDRRLAGLPTEGRQWAANQLAELQSSGILAAALDEPEAPS